MRKFRGPPVILRLESIFIWKILLYIKAAKGPINLWISTVINCQNYLYLTCRIRIFSFYFFPLGGKVVRNLYSMNPFPCPIYIILVIHFRISQLTLFLFIRWTLLSRILLFFFNTYIIMTKISHYLCWPVFYLCLK